MIWLSIYLLVGAAIAARFMWVSRLGILSELPFCGWLMKLVWLTFAAAMFVIALVFWPFAVDLGFERRAHGPR